MPGPSPKEIGIKKDDLTPRDRLMMLKQGLEPRMQNLAEAFGNIAVIKQIENDLEALVDAPTKLMAEIFRPTYQTELITQYETNILQKGEKGELSISDLQAWADVLSVARRRLDAAKDSTT